MYMFTIKWTMLMKYFSDEESDKAQKFLKDLKRHTLCLKHSIV